MEVRKPRTSQQWPIDYEAFLGSTLSLKANNKEPPTGWIGPSKRNYPPGGALRRGGVSFWYMNHVRQQMKSEAAVYAF
eukprot:5805329-Prymnesium_polylepis.1